MPEIVSIALLAFAALLIIGPRRLPESLEALWLALTDFNRTQRGLPPLGSLYNARRFWVSEKNSLYAGIQVLYGVTAHLEELRKRLLIVLITFAVGFLLAFTVAQPLLATIIRPVRVVQPANINVAPTIKYILVQDVLVTGTILTASGPLSGTVTLPMGTELPVALATTTPVVIKPTELFTTYFKLALLAGFAVSLPVVLWQVVIFMRGPKYPYAAMSEKEWRIEREKLTPEALAEAERQRRDVYEGLTAREIRPLYLMMPLALFLFVGGVLFTYFIILPNALDFLFGIGGGLVQPLPGLEDYLDFALTLLFWIGLAFETPLVMFFLARFNIVTARQFIKQWRFAIVGIVAAAAIITPTVDLLNLTLVALPLVGLYALGVLFALLARPRAKKSSLVPVQAQGGQR